MDHLGLVKAIDRLGQGVAVADAAELLIIDAMAPLPFPFRYGRLGLMYLWRTPAASTTSSKASGNLRAVVALRRILSQVQATGPVTVPGRSRQRWQVAGSAVRSASSARHKVSGQGVDCDLVSE